MSVVPKSLYIHFPWCLSKCPYCDFNSYLLQQTQSDQLETYVKLLLVELEREAKMAPTEKINSIYFGGGTPSLLQPNAIKKIIERARSLFSFSDDVEITLEANPGTINFELCEGFKEAGINRISLGVQSFSDEKLKSLGRIHDAKQAQDAIEAIKQAKFSNFNIDLMFGLPGQNIAEALQDLQVALEFNSPHFSWYQLTLEPNTPFAMNPPVLPPNEELWEMQQAGQEVLAQYGLSQYEVSAYSKSGCECRHNINYWQYGDYLGVGAGAHGKITSANGDVRRYRKIASPSRYLQADSLIEGEEIISLERRPFEFMLNALRLYRPISYRLFQERTGVRIDAISKELEQAENLGLIELRNNEIETTEKGRNFLNDLLEMFL